MILLFSLGMTPLANAFLSKHQLDEPEMFFPLEVFLCNNCGLVQLGHVVSPQVLFQDYIYKSSTSKVFRDHFASYTKTVIGKFHVSKNSLVVDIGSNDGILLKSFQELGMNVVGIEPAVRIARNARRDGIPTISEFFSTALARKIIQSKGDAAIVTANNVFAHIDNLDEVVLGVKTLLAPNGVFIIEVPYLIDFIQKKYFDLVYHEHLSYLAVKPLEVLFARFGMTIVDVERVPVHGGSIRVYIQKDEAVRLQRASVSVCLKKELQMKLSTVETYHRFAQNVLLKKARLMGILTKLKASGKSISAYGAPAKGNTLLNYFGIGRELLNFIVDDSRWKQGLYTPGTHIPVVSSETIYQKKPDYLLILAWNFASSIMKMHNKYLVGGGRFIIPAPLPKVISHL